MTRLIIASEASAASSVEPAVAGLTEHEFNLDFHDDAHWFSTFMSASVAVTDFGWRLLDGHAVVAGRNRVADWWGGTRLTSEKLWRWNEPEQKLQAPGE